MNKKNTSLLATILAFAVGLVIGYRLGQVNVVQKELAAIPTAIPYDAAFPETEPTLSASVSVPSVTVSDSDKSMELDEDGTYDRKDDVALYIHTYGHLPQNYVTRSQAKKAGWEGGSLEYCLPGYSIGGDVFRNQEELLPDKRNRIYYECDIETAGKKSRGAKRIVYSNDGLIYYTDDHYESFTLLYGEE